MGEDAHALILGGHAGSPLSRAAATPESLARSHSTAAAPHCSRRRRRRFERETRSSGSRPHRSHRHPRPHPRRPEELVRCRAELAQRGQRLRDQGRTRTRKGMADRVHVCSRRGVRRLWQPGESAVTSVFKSKANPLVAQVMSLYIDIVTTTTRIFRSTSYVRVSLRASLPTVN